MSSSLSQVTELLRRWGRGDDEAFDQLMPLVYERLREIARHRRFRHPGGSLDTTELVHEAYLRLVDGPRTTIRDRAHFLALASRVMRHLLVDQARARSAVKRGGGAVFVPYEDAAWLADTDLEMVNALDLALTKLEALDERQSRMLEQRYFGGLSLEEIADAAGVSLATVKRDLRSARAWLAATLPAEYRG
jgi:RNA polymerase sigma factor (TIGR02999 family)